mgnify:CR=1 FL=1
MGLRSEHENLKSHINSLRGVIFLMFIVIAGLWASMQHQAKTQKVSIPPDIRSGAIVALNESHPANVFAFTAYIFQTLNDWVTDGEVEYGQNAYKLQHFLSKRHMQDLLNDIDNKGRRGELKGRARTVKLLASYDEDHVDILSDDSWVVWLDYEVTEHMKGLEIKQVSVRYPIKVVSTDPTDENPWGLLLDGYSKAPFDLKKLTQ